MTNQPHPLLVVTSDLLTAEYRERMLLSSCFSSSTTAYNQWYNSITTIIPIINSQQHRLLHNQQTRNNAV